MYRKLKQFKFRQKRYFQFPINNTPSNKKPKPTS